VHQLVNKRLWYSFYLKLADFTTEILRDLCKSRRSSLSICNILGTLLNSTNSHIHLYNWKGQSKQHVVYCNAHYTLCILWLSTASVMLSQVYSIFHHLCTAFIPLNSHYFHPLVNFPVKCAMVMILMIILQEFVSPPSTNYPPLAPQKNKHVGWLLNYDLYMDFLFQTKFAQSTAQF
jgi:hypothetical protein